MPALDFSEFELAARLAMMQSSRAAAPPAPADVPDVAIEHAPAIIPPISASVASCRELVEIYLRKPAISTLRETIVALSANVATQVLQADPRRIRLEIFVAAIAISPGNVKIGSQAVVQAGNGSEIFQSTAATTVITRDYRTDLDSVARELWAQASSGNWVLSFRETLLTPLPVDELGVSAE